MPGQRPVGVERGVAGLGMADEQERAGCHRVSLAPVPGDFRRTASGWWTGPVTAIPGIDPSVPPSGPGCVECEQSGGWWFHLRRCAQCGHIGCCDSSPSQHARAHALVPDRVLVSPARRAVQTWAAAAERLAAAEPTVDPRIYENTFDAVLEAIHETPDEVGCLAVVGHNPSIGGLAHELAHGSRDDGFPAAGVAVLELTGTFAAVAPGTATLSRFRAP